MSNRRHKGPVGKPRVIKPNTEAEQKTEKNPRSNPVATIRRFSAAVVRPDNVLSLQQTIGNKAVLRLLDDTNQRQSRQDRAPLAKTRTVAGVVQRHKGNMTILEADQTHNKLKTAVSNSRKSSKSISKAYYDHNADKIDSLKQRVTAVEGREE